MGPLESGQGPAMGMLRLAKLLQVVQEWAHKRVWRRNPATLVGRTR